MASSKEPLVLDPKAKSFLLNDAIYYEIIFALGVSIHDPKDYCVWEHLNHSRLGHARALIYFFECSGTERKWSDDIVSEDFGFPAQRLVLQKSERDRLNKDLFHISAARLRHDQLTKPWTHEILTRVHERTLEFIRFLLSPTVRRDYEVEDNNWRVLLTILDGGHELLIQRPFTPRGVASGWMLGTGRMLSGKFSELTATHLAG